MTGFVGGDPSAMQSAGAGLGSVGERVASIVSPYAAATRAGVDAAGQGSPMVAVARCGSLWAQALVALAEEVGALGQVAEEAAADLWATERS